MYSADEQDGFWDHSALVNRSILNKSEKKRRSRHATYGYKIQWSCNIPLPRCFQSHSDEVEYWLDVCIENLFRYQTDYILIVIFGILPWMLWAGFNGTIYSASFLCFVGLLVNCLWTRSENDFQKMFVLLMFIVSGYIALMIFYRFFIYCIILQTCILFHAAYSGTNENRLIPFNGEKERLRKSPMGILLQSAGVIEFTDY